jgi:ElaB/YqjD/DUF883 family membrane-anchored ribosome-binding protein
MEKNNNLLKEFEVLIEEVSQSIIDNTIMDDLKKLRVELNEQMKAFSEQASGITVITERIDQLFSDTSSELTGIVETTTRDLNGFLKETNETIYGKLSSIINDLDKILEGSNELIKSSFNEAKSDIKIMLDESTHTTQESLEGARHYIDQLLERSNERFDKSIEHVTDDFKEINLKVEGSINNGVNSINQEIATLNGVTENLLDQLNSFTDDYTNKIQEKIEMSIKALNDVTNNTEERFVNEVNMLKSFLVNAEKLIKNNQFTIRDIQIAIEEKLNEVVVTIKEETNRNKLNFNQAVGILQELSNDFGKQVDLVTARNEMVLNKQESIFELLHKQEEKSKKRFMISLIMSFATFGSVVGVLIYMLLKG